MPTRKRATFLTGFNPLFMELFEHAAQLANWRGSKNQTVGFVPTMGALHNGHLSLVQNARKRCDIVVASIFVNPTQFNDPADLEHYPRQVPQDLQMLEQAGCDAVLVPTVEEMYPNGVSAPGPSYSFGALEQVMEGAKRPGHFAGVAQIVSRLFEIVQPNLAFFGDKDFQQLAIIRELQRQGNYNIEIVGCPIVREQDGLAMSSRNQLLKPEEREAAPFLYQCLQQAKVWAGTLSPAEICALLSAAVEEHPKFALDYFDIVHAQTLQPIGQWDQAPEARACVAAFIGDVRLIDNAALPVR